MTGDCKQHICLMGKDTAAPDDSDVPAVPAAMAGCADAKCTERHALAPAPRDGLAVQHVHGHDARVLRRDGRVRAVRPGLRLPRARARTASTRRA